MSRGSLTTNMAEFLRREIHAVSDLEFFLEALVHPSQFLSRNVLWSRNVHKQQPERNELFIFSGLSLTQFSLS